MVAYIAASRDTVIPSGDPTVADAVFLLSRAATPDGGADRASDHKEETGRAGHCPAGFAIRSTRRVSDQLHLAPGFIASETDIIGHGTRGVKPMLVPAAN
jgi:hypothetical protein